MADNWANVDKQVQDFFTKNQKTNKQIQNAITESLDNEVEILKQYIISEAKKNTYSADIRPVQVILDSMKIIDGNYPNEKIIIFDESSIRQSAFKTGYFGFTIDNYSPDAYLPILINEGYKVKKKPWDQIFGSREAEHFIENGIEEYQRKNKGKLNIKVEKIGDFKYNGYTSSINEETYYNSSY